MTRDVRACTIHDSLNAAARIMWEHDCGCVPVVDATASSSESSPIATSAWPHTRRASPLEAIPVERVMSAKVISCSRTDDLDTAHRLMRTHEIHRIPVVDSRGRLDRHPVAERRRESCEPWRARTPKALEIIATLHGDSQTPRATAATVAPASSNGDAPSSRDSSKPPKKTATQSAKPSADLPLDFRLLSPRRLEFVHAPCASSSCTLVESANG